MKFPSGFLQKRIRRKIPKTRSLDMHCYNCSLHTTLPFQILKKKILCFWLKNFDRLIMAFPFSMIPFMNLVCERILWTERCKELERDEYQRRNEQMTSGHDQGCLWRRVRRRPKTDMDKEQFEDNLLVNTLTKKISPNLTSTCKTLSCHHDGLHTRCTHFVNGCTWSWYW